MLIIGDKINSSIKSVATAIETKDENFVQKLAMEQVAAGADMLDVNTGAFVDTEIELLPWLVKKVQDALWMFPFALIVQIQRLFAAVNFAPLVSGILSFPLVRGFKPVRAFLTTIENLPKP